MISVIIPAHNYARYLRQTIKSVLDQSYKNVEVIVVDDSSTDGTEKVVRTFGGVKYFRVNFKNPQKTRNYGWKKSKGKYLLFLDADNYLKPGFLEKTLSAFTSNDIGFVYTDRDLIVEDSAAEEHSEYFRRNPPGPYNYYKLQHNNYIDMCALIRRDVFEGFNTNLKHLQDWGLWLELAQKGYKGKFIPDKLFVYRFHDKNMNKQIHQVKEEAYNKILKKYKIGDGMVTIFIPFSGKHYSLFPVLRGLDDLEFAKKGIGIIIYDNSCDEGFSIRLLKFIKEKKQNYWFLRYIRDDTPNVKDVTHWSKNISNRCAQIYSHLPNLVNSEYTFIVEDDVAIPPFSLQDLLDSMEPTVGAVSGCVIDKRNFLPLAWNITRGGETSPRVALKNSGTEEVMGTGMGCLLVKSKLLRKIRYSKKFSQDVAFCNSIYKQGYKLLINWDVHAHHYDQKVVVVK